MRRVPENILLIKMSSLGDVVHALPALWALRDRFPRARISWLVAEEFADLITGHPALDSVLVAKASRWPGGSPLPHVLASAFQLAGVAGELRQRRFDLVVDLQGLLRSAVAGAVTGAATRVGFREATEGAPLLYTHRVMAPRRLHAVRRCLALARALGAPDGPVRFRIPLTAAGRAAAAHLCHASGIPRGEYVVVAPRSSCRAKDWPADRFADVARRLWERHRLPSVVIGGMSDGATCSHVVQASRCPALSVADQPLTVSAALIAGARLLVGNDSGPLHLGAGLGRPVVGIYGPTAPEQFGPWGRAAWTVRAPGCRACRRGGQTTIPRWLPARHNCLRDVPVSAIWSAIEQALSFGPALPFGEAATMAGERFDGRPAYS